MKDWEFAAIIFGSVSVMVAIVVAIRLAIEIRKILKEYSERR